MSGIFGIFFRDGALVEPSSIEAMRTAMACWGRDGGGVWLEGCAGLGQLLTFATVEAVHERLPAVDAATGCVFTAQGRLDNREELIRQTGFDGDRNKLSDGELMRRAYLKWGEEAPSKLFGDWSMAAWHRSERRLFLARDHLGSAGIYYHCSPDLFAFASDRGALLALDLKQTRIDELFLAKLLLPWRDFHDERTVQSTIQRLPPAHCLRVTSDAQLSRLYWRLEDVPEIRFARRGDYVEAFRELFTDAVRQRLREPSGSGRVACMLSGGLDSGSVTATAAALVRPSGRRITALTSTPAYDTTSFFRDGLGDELPDARETADFAGNVDLVPIPARMSSPVGAIRRQLAISNEPIRASGNVYWMLDLNREVNERGFRVLLSGQAGNAGSSWQGDFCSQPLAVQLRHLGARGVLSRWLRRGGQRFLDMTPTRWWAARHRWYCRDGRFWTHSPIHPDLVRRLDLLSLWIEQGKRRLWMPPLQTRHWIVRPGRSFAAAQSAELGVPYGLDVRDPTADVRVLEFAFAVPDEVFIEPSTGQDRWLIREFTRNLLPDRVRLKSRQGNQAGDIVWRLRADATEVEAALREVEVGPASALLDVRYMRDVWRAIQDVSHSDTVGAAVMVLLRGLAVGLFVNAFHAAGEKGLPPSASF